MRIGWTAAAALLVVAGGACRGPGATPPPERFIRADAPLAVIVPTLRTAQEQARALLGTVVQFPAAADVGPAVTATRDQLGLDPLDARAVEEAGIDVARGAGFAPAGAGAPALLVLPARDAGKLEATVARLARDRLGAARRDVERSGTTAVVVFRTGEGASPAVALSTVGGTTLLSAGLGCSERVAAAASLDPAASLASSPPFAVARKAAGSASTALVYAPAGSPATSRSTLARDGAALALSGSASRFSARVVLLLEPARQEWWRGVASPPGAGTAGLAALGLLPRPAFLVGRFDGDTAAVARRALPSAPDAVASLRRAGLDAERDLLAQLAPGFAASVSLAPTFEVAAVSRGDLRASDPFRLVHLAAVANVKDPAAAQAMLLRLARAAPALGMTATRVRVGELGAWRFGWRSSVLEVALQGPRLLAGGGPGVLESLVVGTADKYAAPTEITRSALSSGVAAAVLDFGRFVESFRSLPSAAYGTGPDAFVMRSLAERVVDPASRLTAASVRLELTADAALVDVAVEARTGGEP